MRHVPLKHLVRINQRSLPETTEPDYAFGYVDIGSVGRGVLLEEPLRLTFADAPSRARRLVSAGDTIISTVRTYLRAAWPVEEPSSDLVVSTGFAVLTPGPELEPRYLGWLAQSDIVVEGIVARSVGVSYPATNALEIGDLRVPLVTLSEQRVIAAFLDAETTRIDTLIAKKQRHARLIRSRAQAAIDGALNSVGTWVPLGRVLSRAPDSLIAGPFGSDLSGSDLQASGTMPVFNQRNVLDASFDSFDYFVDDPKMSELRRFWTYPGDILVTARGSIGSCAIVPPYAPTGVLHPCLLRVRTDPSVLLPALLEESIRWSSQIRHSLLLQSTATTIEVVYSRTLRNVSVPAPSLDLQDPLLQHIRRLDDWSQRSIARVHCQIALLQERRQALITAAVTGELDHAEAG